jgi:hypothetical protein
MIQILEVIVHILFDVIIIAWLVSATAFIFLAIFMVGSLLLDRLFGTPGPRKAE